MKALFTFGADVPVSRVIADHRRWLMPVGVVLAINIVVLVAVVLPLRRSVQSGSSRADASAQALREARRRPEGSRGDARRTGAGVEGSRCASMREVLPADFRAARRMTQLKLAQMARVARRDASRAAPRRPKTLRDSSLERLHVNYSLSGDWDDIRQLIYEIETGPDFIVIDNVQLAEGSQANAPLSLTLDLSTYYRVAHVR